MGALMRRKTMHRRMNRNERTNQTVENALLLFQLLRAPQQIENLRVVINPDAVLRRILSVHQFGQRYGQCLTERLNHAVIRHTLAVFPFGDGLVGHAQLLRQLFLRQILFPTFARDVAADGCLIHFECLLC